MSAADIIAERDSLRRAAHALEERVNVLEDTVARLRGDRDEEATERRRAEGEREYERRRAVAAEKRADDYAEQLTEFGARACGFALTIICADCGAAIATLGESPAHAAVMLAHQASMQFTTDGPRVVCRGCAAKAAPKEAA